MIRFALVAAAPKLMVEEPIKSSNLVKNGFHAARTVDASRCEGIDTW